MRYHMPCLLHHPKIPLLRIRIEPRKPSIMETSRYLPSRIKNFLSPGNFCPGILIHGQCHITSDFNLIEVNYKSCLTLGIIVVWAHSTPNFSTSFLRLLVAASRMAKTWSTNQVMHSVLSFSSKNSTPSWPKNEWTIQNNERYLVKLYLSQAFPLDNRKKLKVKNTKNSRRKLKLKLKTQLFGIFQKSNFVIEKKSGLY